MKWAGVRSDCVNYFLQNYVCTFLLKFLSAMRRVLLQALCAAVVCIPLPWDSPSSVSRLHWPGLLDKLHLLQESLLYTLSTIYSLEPGSKASIRSLP